LLSSRGGEEVVVVVLIEVEVEVEGAIWAIWAIWAWMWVSPDSAQ
jgi:formylmethanofuran dehydrogenase subunit D